MRQVLAALLIVFILPLSNAQKLLIGTTPLNPPFETLADKSNHFFGFDIDIIVEVCRRLNQPCEFTPIIYNDLFSSLETQKIDIAIAAIIVTSQVQNEFQYSLPYLPSYARFLSLQNIGIESIENITNKKVGTRLGTPFKQLALTLYPNRITTVDYPTIAALLRALSKQNVDCILINDAAALYWYANNSQLYQLIGDKIPIGGGYRILANKANANLMTRINQALIAMQNDGSYAKIYSRYFE